MTNFVDFLCLESAWKIKEIVILCHKSWQFRGDVCCNSKQTGNPDCRRNVTKRWKRRLKGSPCQPGIVSQLQPASSPTIYRSLCRKDKTRRAEGGEESHKLCKLAPLVLHLNPGLENDTADSRRTSLSGNHVIFTCFWSSNSKYILTKYILEKAWKQGGVLPPTLLFLLWQISTQKMRTFEKHYQFTYWPKKL